MKRGVQSRKDRLVKAGLVGAGVLTMTWWTLLGFGLWHAIAWAAH